MFQGCFCFTTLLVYLQFEKSYAYNVRHSYGKEGKRANYTAYSCMKIIMSNAPSQGDHHGEHTVVGELANSVH